MFWSLRLKCNLTPPCQRTRPRFQVVSAWFLHLMSWPQFWALVLSADLDSWGCARLLSYPVHSTLPHLSCRITIKNQPGTSLATPGTDREKHNVFRHRVWVAALSVVLRFLWGGWRKWFPALQCKKEKSRQCSRNTRRTGDNICSNVLFLMVKSEICRFRTEQWRKASSWGDYF